MEGYTQITLDQWVQWKEDIRQKLAETADNFVHIGYRLKQIRDSGMFGGAADIFEFAQKEYGLGKSTVSRFIAINEKYSEGGNSLELKAEFRGFSSSKLSEMLTLPDNEIELINEKTTIRAIRDLKQFNADAQEQGALGMDGQTPFERCIIDFFRTRQELLDRVLDLYRQGTREAEKLAVELLNPSGQAYHRKGIVFLFLYEWGEGVKYKLMTEPEPVHMTWTEFFFLVAAVFGPCPAADFYRQEDAALEAAPDAYGEKDAAGEPEEKGPVATSQQEAGKGQDAHPQKAQAAAEGSQGTHLPKTPTAAGKKLEQKPLIREPEAEGQVEGQTTIERDFREYLPEGQQDSALEAAPDAARLKMQEYWNSAMDVATALSNAFAIHTLRAMDKETVMQMYNRAVGMAADLERILMLWEK